MFTDQEVIAQAIINSRLMLTIKQMEAQQDELVGRIKELEAAAADAAPAPKTKGSK